MNHSTPARVALFLAVFSIILSVALALDSRTERLAAEQREQHLTETVLKLEKRVQALEAATR